MPSTSLHNPAQTEADTPLYEVDSRHGPDLKKVLAELNDSLTDVGEWIGQAQTNEKNTLCLWQGQSADGLKWKKHYGHDVFPWEGAADTRQRLIETAINKLVHLQTMAFFGMDVHTEAMESNDVDAAGRVQTLLRYELQQRMHAELWQEMNFATAWMLMFGHSVMGTFWQTEKTTGTETVTLQDLVALKLDQLKREAAYAQGIPEEEAAQDDSVDPMLADTAALLVETMLLDDEQGIIDLLTLRWPNLPAARLKRIVKHLRERGQDTFRVPVDLPGRPTVKAYLPGFDIFYPWHVANVAESPWVIVQESYWAPELRAKVAAEGWKEEFVNAVLAQEPGELIHAAALDNALNNVATERMFASTGRNLLADRQALQEKYCVLRCFVQAIDEDGIPALHEVIVHPNVTDRNGQPIAAINRVVDYWHGKGCFTSFRREYLIRSLWENRGVPEVTDTAQMEMKANRDSILDRTALATLPPVRASNRRLPGGGARWEALGIKPGSTVPTDPAGTTEFMALPAFRPDDSVRRLILVDLANLLGLMNPDLPAEETLMHRQWLVNNFLVQARELVLRILALDQQFMDPLNVSRVIGSGTMPFVVTREEIQGQYDVRLKYDVRSSDMEWVKARLGVVKEAVGFDRSGAFKDVPMMKWLIASIDPNLADLVISDMMAARAGETDDEKKAIAALITGVELTPPQGANAQVRLETDRGEISNNPAVLAQYQQNPQFRAMMDARMGKWQFDLQQRQNAQIGREGWQPALEGAQP